MAPNGFLALCSSSGHLRVPVDDVEKRLAAPDTAEKKTQRPKKGQHLAVNSTRSQTKSQIFAKNVALRGFAANKMKKVEARE